MFYVRNGSGRPLLLVHGLGGNHRSWDTILPDLVAQRDVVTVDLPGHGATPALPEMTFAALADALVAFLEDEGLTGIDAVGTSICARLVLELARRGLVGDVVSLDPGVSGRVGSGRISDSRSAHRSRSFARSHRYYRF